ncbi:MAG: signal transduction protein [Alphaproteobacteria bacterium]|nr:signal transduction protein [Alphaproteobacteria bacterium]
MEALGGGEAIEGLARTKAAEAGIAADLLGEGMDAPSILALLVDINRDIHRRVLERAVAATAESGLGAPPVAFTGLVLGSAGRGESLLGPDQDNALILDDYDDNDHTRIDRWFVALAERFTRDLATVGFPLCSGNVMATNPVWRKTATQWRRQMTLWAERRSPVAVLFADIFLDFHPFTGDPTRSETLRAHVLDGLARNPAFLAEIAGTQANHAVAVGLLGRLHTVHGDLGRRGHVDLKLGGLMPLVGAVRLLALRAGVAATGTARRLDALADRGLVEPDRRDGLIAAFATLAGLLLRQQIADLRAGRPPSNDIVPDKLRRRSRDDLVEALRAVRSFHNAVIADFTGRLW